MTGFVGVDGAGKSTTIQCGTVPEVFAEIAGLFLDVWNRTTEGVGGVAVAGGGAVGRGPVEVRAARVVLRREQGSPHGSVVHATFPVYL